MITKANKHKMSSASQIPNTVCLQSKKQKLLNCNKITEGFFKLCKNQATIQIDNTTLTFSAKTRK